MTGLNSMTDAELNAETDYLAGEVRAWEAITDQAENDFNRDIALSILKEYVENWRQALDEQRRRMGVWIGR